jgi:hypothetical protein
MRLSPWRHTRVRIACTWPSELPGVNMAATGKLLFEPTAELRQKGRAAARAAARLALDSLASSITHRFPPTLVQVAQEKLALATAQWTDVEGHPHVRIKARIALGLGSEDRARTQAYEDALRAERLRHAIDRERLAHLQAVLGEPGLARAWWLDRQREELLQLSWNEFNEKVLPTVGPADDTHLKAVRVAQVITEVVERLGEEPGREKQFVATARVLLEEMGWEDLAEALPQD